MDLLEVKNRIAEAMVESIFRRARYSLIPVGEGAIPGASVRVGREELLAPHMRVRRETDDQVIDLPLSVKYRLHIDQYLAIENQRGPKSIFKMAWRQWPEMRFIFLSERPDKGRSCFQVVPPSQAGEAEIQTVDLADEPQLQIFKHDVEDHEELVRRIFLLLAGG